MKRKPAAKEARGGEKKPKTGNNSSNGAQSGRNAASEKKRKQLKKEARKEGGVVWLVFVEDESGGNGSYGGYGYDNGSHSVELIGVYGTEAAADAAAGAHREEEDVDEHDGCDGEPRCQAYVIYHI